MISDRNREFISEILQIFSDMTDVSEEEEKVYARKLEDLKKLHEEKIGLQCDIRFKYEELSKVRSKNKNGDNYQKMLANLNETVQRYNKTAHNCHIRQLQTYDKLRRGAKIFRSLLEYMPIGSIDSYLKPLATFFTNQFEKAPKEDFNENNPEIQTLLYTCFSAFCTIDKKLCDQFNNVFLEMLYGSENSKNSLPNQTQQSQALPSYLLEDISDEEEGDIDTKQQTIHELIRYYQTEKILVDDDFFGILCYESCWFKVKKIVGIRYFIDAFILHGMLKEQDEPNEELQENHESEIDNQSEESEEFALYETVEQMTKVFFEGDLLVRNVLVEGIIKIILGDELPNPENWFMI